MLDKERALQSLKQARDYMYDVCDAINDGCEGNENCNFCDVRVECRRACRLFNGITNLFDLIMLRRDE